MVRKKQLYAELLGRQKGALEAGYHYESCWFAHAIFEDRSRSIVENSADGRGYGGNISEKLSLILDRLDMKVTKVANGKAVKDKKTGNKEKVPRWPHLF